MKLLSRLLPSVLVLFATVAFVSRANAQDASNLYMAGASYSAGGSPAFAGSALYAHELTTSGLYAFTMLDALPSSKKPFTVTTNIGAGVAQKVVTIAGVPVFIPTEAGISYTGTNTGWAWSTGAAAIFKVKPFRDGNVYVMPTLRVLKSSVSGDYQPILGVLFGWGKAAL